MASDKKTSTSKTKIIPFKFTLTDDEKEDRTQRLTQAISDVYGARDNLKETSKELREVVKGYEKQVSELRDVVANGAEWRDVECEERHYRASGEVVTYRMDTGEQVDVRPMTMAERQMRFDDLMDEGKGD